MGSSPGRRDRDSPPRGCSLPSVTDLRRPRRKPEPKSKPCRGRRGGEGIPPFDRTGDVDELLAAAIAAYPVTGHGQRNNMMVRLAGHLLDRRYEPRLTIRVMVRWWRHFHALGMIRTSPAIAEVEVKKCLNCMVRSPGFVWTGRWIEREIAANLDGHIRHPLNVRVSALRVSLAEELVSADGSAAPGGEPQPNRKTVTLHPGVRIVDNCTASAKKGRSMD